MPQKIRLGMVGGGQGAFIGAVHRIASRIDDRYELLAGAFSSNAEKAIASGQEIGIDEDRNYKNFNEMIEAESSREDKIDAVAIVTPNHMHHPIALAFMSKGFNVICDKPLAMNLKQCEELVQSKQDNDVLFALTHNYTGYPMIRNARALCHNGDLGKIRVIQAEYAQDWLTEDLENKTKNDGNKQASWSSTDPKVTIDYKPTESSMLWYTYATGFKSGGWQFANYFKELVEQGFDPEELEMNEIGYKGSFLNDSLSVSAVAYAYDWTDKQVIKVSVVQGLPVGITQNAGSSKINGLDLNLRASVADQTIINFNYAYIDAAYDVFCDDSRDWTDVHGSFTSCDSTKVGAYNRSGGKMPWTPDNAMVFSVEHVEPTTIGDVIINTSYSYKTNVGNADERVAGLTFLDEIARLNFSTTIEFNNGTSLRGFCTNCLDVDDDIGFTLIYPGGQGGGARIKYYDGMRAGLEVVHQF